jgi:hypothetical protein
MRRIGLAAAAAVFFHGTGVAATGADCVLAMATAETEARVTFETGLAELVEGVAPEQAEVAGLSRDIQVMLARDRLDRVAYLTEARPQAFEAESGGLDWTDGDEAAYMADPDHAARMAEIASLGQRLEAHPDFATLQDIFRTVVVKLFEFQKLMVDHNTARREAADAFSACRGA